MAGDGEMYLCEACRQPLELDGPDTVQAHRWTKATSFDGEEYLEGEPALYHLRHYPGDSLTLRRG